MRLLLDTHIFLWAVADDRKLSKTARKLISDAEEVFVSSASIWEASIKAGLGKLDADVTELVSAIETSGFKELPARPAHAALDDWRGALAPCTGNVSHASLTGCR